MGSFASGQVILLPFPYSDLSASKLRPALVLAQAGKDDWVLCQITSNPYADPLAVELLNTDFVLGGLQRVSYARPGKLFTAHESLFRRTAGTLNQIAYQRVVDTLVGMLQRSTLGRRVE
jgi:mRNA interferase MazF